VMREYRVDPEAGESLLEMLRRSLLDTYRRGSKASRDYPRKKSRESEMIPKLLAATAEQIRNAKKSSGQPVLGLTA